MRSALAQDGGAESLALPPDRALDLSRRTSAACNAAMNQGHDKVVLLCDFRLRPHLAALLSRQLPHLPVLAYDEVTVGTPVESIATISMEAPDRVPPETPATPEPALAAAAT